MPNDKTFELVKDDITARVVAKLPGGFLFQPGKLTVSVTVTLPADIDQKEPRMVTQMKEACFKGIPPLIDRVGGLLKKHDEQAANTYISTSNGNLEKICADEQKKFKAAAKKESDAYAKTCKKAVEKIFNATQSRKTAYKTYKIKIAANLLVGAAVFATGVTMLATAPVVAPLGVYNTIKAGSSLISTIVKSMQNAEQIEKKIKVDLARYKKLWQTVARQGTKTKATYEIVGKAIHFAGGVIFEEAFPNISTFEKNVKQFGQKLNGIDGQVDKLSKSVMGYIQAQDKIRDSMRPLEDYYVKLATLFGARAAKKKVLETGMAIANLNRSLILVELDLKKTLQSVDEMNDSLIKGRTAEKQYKGMVQDFKGKKWPSKWLLAADISLAAGDMLSRGLTADWDKVGRSLGSMAAKTTQYGGKLTKKL